MDDFPVGNKEEKLTTSAKSGETFFSKIWKENAVDETDKKENENKSFDTEIGVTDESVFANVFKHSTAEELVMLYAFVEGQDGSGVGSHDVVCGFVQIELDEPGNSEGKKLLQDGNKITAGRVRESCLDNGDEDWPLGIDRKKDSSLNWEPQLLGSNEKNSEMSFSYVASDGMLQSKQTVPSAIEQSLMLRQRNVSFAEELFSRKSSNSESEYGVLHKQKVELRNDKALSLSETIDV